MNNINNKLMNLFGISKDGVKLLYKAIFTSILEFITFMLPIISIMLMVELSLSNNNINEKTIVIYSSVSIIIMIIILYINYNNLYTCTYKECSNIRFSLINKFVKLPMSFFSKHDLTDLSQTLMADVGAIEHALSHAIPQSIALFIYLVIIMILLLICSPLISLGIIIPSILSILFIFLTIRYQRKTFNKYYLQERENSKTIQECIELKHNMDSLNIGDEMRDKLLNQLDSSQRLRTKVEFTVAILLNISLITAYSQIAFTILLGLKLYSLNLISLTYLIGYIFSSAGISSAMAGFFENIGELSYIDSHAGKIRMIREAEIKSGIDCELKSFDVEANNLFFSYNPDRLIIDDVSCVCENGKITAIVGSSGSGKTTLLRLFANLYEPNKGVIKIGDQDISLIDSNSLYKNISVVFQEVLLFKNSIMENIRIGKISASDEEVIEAAKKSGCHEFIERLPDGYNTIIGENGCTLSGGERQRLSIARAILKDAPIILLDELTSSLDIENERNIQRALVKLIKNKTVILITHRLKLAQNVDKIIALDNGKIDGIGKHDELMNTSKIYRNLVDKSNKIGEFKYKT